MIMGGWLNPQLQGVSGPLFLRSERFRLYSEPDFGVSPSRRVDAGLRLAVSSVHQRGREKDMRTLTVLLLAGGLAVAPPLVKAQGFSGRAAPAAAPAQAGRGVVVNEPGASPGYTLIAPMNSRKTYLIDLEGGLSGRGRAGIRPASRRTCSRTATSSAPPSSRPRSRCSAAWREGGGSRNSPGTASSSGTSSSTTNAGSPTTTSARCRNGNVLLIAWEVKTGLEALAAGRKAETVRGPVLADMIVEVKPTGRTTGEVVWEWLSLGPSDPGQRPLEGQLRRRGPASGVD